MKISEFQSLIKKLYLSKDLDRGIEKTFLWLVEELGELATLLKEDEINKQNVAEELADIIAWTTSIANILKINLEEAIKEKYPGKCKRCGFIPCQCD